MSAPFRAGELLFFATPPHPCSYLPGRTACSVFADPAYPMDAPTYSLLSRNGFRRSGRHVYRPNCENCDACIAIRVSTEQFRPNRSQRRTWRANRALDVVPCDSGFRMEHYQLYRRYVNLRHPGSDMQDPEPDQYMEFLRNPWAEAVFYEFRDAGELLAVAVVDVLSDGLSAVYTFFEPGASPRSPGVYALLWLIREANRLGLRWVYLGYWIADCAKMSYKRDYQPHQLFLGGHWVGPEAPIASPEGP